MDGSNENGKSAQAIDPAPKRIWITKEMEEHIRRAITQAYVDQLVSEQLKLQENK